MEEQMEEQFVSGAGAATDDMFHQHTKKQQENFSSNQYKAGFNEQIKGQRAQTTRDGHPEYLHAEKQQQNVSETHYKQQAAKARQTTNVDGESFREAIIMLLEAFSFNFLRFLGFKGGGV